MDVSRRVDAIGRAPRLWRSSVLIEARTSQSFDASRSLTAYASGEDRRRAYPAALSTAVLGSSFRWGDAMIFFEKEFDLLDAFIGEGQDSAVIVGAVHPDDAVLGLETEGQVLDERFADAEVPGDTVDGIDVMHLIARRRGTKSPMTAKREITAFAASASNIVSPFLHALKAWLDDIAPKLPDSKLGDAVSYTLTQWGYLTRYTEDGSMCRSTIIFSSVTSESLPLAGKVGCSAILSTEPRPAPSSSAWCCCRACGVEPLAWLRHVLTELPQRNENVAIDDLLPSTSCFTASTASG